MILRSNQIINMVAIRVMPSVMAALTRTISDDAQVDVAGEQRVVGEHHASVSTRTSVTALAASISTVGDGSPWPMAMVTVPTGTEASGVIVVVSEPWADDTLTRSSAPTPRRSRSAGLAAMAGAGGEAGERRGGLHERALVVELAVGDQPQRVGVERRGLVGRGRRR